MLKRIKSIFSRTDYKLFLLMFSLSTVGVLSIYSAGYDPSLGEVEPYYEKQTMWLALSVIAFFVFSSINYSKLILYSIYIYALGILLLIIVEITGLVGMGAQRWLSIGPLTIQPSEVFKIIWVITLGKIFMDFDGQSFGIIKIVKKSLLLIPPFFLVFLQPDLGTAMTYFIVWSSVILFFGIKRKTFIIIIISLLCIAPLAWSNLRDYQKDRVLTFLNPENDPFGSGYHVIQSKIAIGSGGITGKGYLKGTQSHLRFIPERHTDFIYSVINEEFGLIGGFCVVILFFLLLLRILSISSQQKDAGGKVIAFAVASYIFFQFMINSYMTVGMMPIVGIPMPFISYGGSSLLSFYSMLGIVNSIHIRKWRGID